MNLHIPQMDAPQTSNALRDHMRAMQEYLLQRDQERARILWQQDQRALEEVARQDRARRMYDAFYGSIGQLYGRQVVSTAPEAPAEFLP